LAERHRLTLYDAAYLERALRRGLPLTTLDRGLHAAASGEKIQVLGLEAKGEQSNPTSRQ
jgi:predicted nucleic acid-binding protein